MKFQQLIDIMKANKLEKLADIARELNVSPQALNNWKLRDQIPYKIGQQVKTNYSLEPKLFNDKSRKNIIEKSSNDFSPLNQNFQPYFLNEDNISLWEIITVLNENIRILIIVPSIIFILSLIYAFLIAVPIYTSSATIIPVNAESSMGNMAGIASQFGFSVPMGGKGPKISYPEVILSRTIAKKIIHRQFYTKKFESKKPLLHYIVDEKNDPKTMEQIAIKSFRRLITVNEDIKTSIVTISAAAKEPKLASDILNSLIEELDEHLKKFNTEQAAKKRIFIEERIKDVNVDLVSAEEKLKQFRQANKKYSDSPSLLLSFERLLREVEVQKQLYITLKKEFELAYIEEVEDSDFFYVLDSPEEPLNRSKPKRKLIVILSSMFGLGLGLIGAFVKNWYLEQKKDNIRKKGK